MSMTAKEVIYCKHKTGGSLNLIQVKKRLLRQMKFEEYWALLNNEMLKIQTNGNALLIICKILIRK